MKIFLGVDGGQSSTTAVIGDETGRILGRGVGGPCNHATAAEGRAKLKRAVLDCVGAAAAEAGLTGTLQFEAACFGMSGGPDDKVAILEQLITSRQTVVTTDAAIALSASTSSGEGIIVIAGTGSMAFGRNHDGVTARAGGWGYVFGDEGSGFDIAREALRAALRMEEGWGPETALRQKLLDATGLGSANDVLHAFYKPEWPRDRIAKFAALVNEVALEGDRIASEILRQCGSQLAMLATFVRSRLWTPDDKVEVAYSGGVFHSGFVRERFRSLMELDSNVACGPCRLSPVEGALLQAYRMAGVIIRIESSA